jgi:sRNA-binding carbon storage regulator CsrA
MTDSAVVSRPASGVKMLDAKVGDTLRLQVVDMGEISVTICAKDGQRVRLGVQAGPNVIVHRPERKAVR